MFALGLDIGSHFYRDRYRTQKCGGWVFTLYPHFKLFDFYKGYSVDSNISHILADKRGFVI